jgi:hypothetical protein
MTLIRLLLGIINSRKKDLTLASKYYDSIMRLLKSNPLLSLVNSYIVDFTSTS